MVENKWTIYILLESKKWKGKYEQVTANIKFRKVLNTSNGREMMYEIQQNTGDNFNCNESHILSVIQSGQKFNNGIPSYIEDINIKNALNLSKNHRKKLFKVPLNFQEKNKPLVNSVKRFTLSEIDNILGK